MCCNGIDRQPKNQHRFYWCLIITFYSRGGIRLVQIFKTNSFSKLILHLIVYVFERGKIHVIWNLADEKYHQSCTSHVPKWNQLRKGVLMKIGTCILWVTRWAFLSFHIWARTSIVLIVPNCLVWYVQIYLDLAVSPPCDMHVSRA